MILLRPNIKLGPGLYLWRQAFKTLLGLYSFFSLLPFFKNSCCPDNECCSSPSSLAAQTSPKTALMHYIKGYSKLDLLFNVTHLELTEYRFLPTPYFADLGLTESILFHSILILRVLLYNWGVLFQNRILFFSDTEPFGLEVTVATSAPIRCHWLATLSTIEWKID